MFRVGQKVTLKTPEPFFNMVSGETAPVFGEVYTIRRMRHFELRTGNAVGLVFFEIYNPPTTAREECVFSAEAFRPVVTRKTDISCFTKMLNTESINAAP